MAHDHDRHSRGGARERGNLERAYPVVSAAVCGSARAVSNFSGDFLTKSRTREVMVPAHTVIGGGGVRIHVEEAGNPQRPPVLFIHGFSQSLLSWFRQLESQPLSGQLRLFAMDSRGHGRSDKPLDPNAYDDSAQWAADVNNVITGLGLNQPVLCGWSYGQCPCV